MVYLKVIDFLTSHDVVVLGVVFALVWIFGIVNWCVNVYRVQNKKFTLCQRNILLKPQFTGLYIACLTEEYRRQWRAYVNSNAARPGLVFEFVPRKNKVVLWPVFVLCALVSFAYLAIFLWKGTFREYAVFQAAFWLSFVLVLLINKLAFKNKEKRARQIFGRFVAQLNALRGEKVCRQSVSQQLQQLKNQDATDALAKASQLLRQNGLESTRTVEEQQQINKALNGLLQAYARNASQKT